MSHRTLVIETATAACSVALFDGDALIASCDEVVGRGHAERLVPMIAQLPDGGRADTILVDVGPGSFTGIRVGIAAARGLALGWGASVAGFSSLALVAMDEFLNAQQVLDFAVVLEGGHGEVFMQQFAGRLEFAALGDFASLPPAEAIARLGTMPAVGTGLDRLADLPASQKGPALLPSAMFALALPASCRTLPPRPLYGRAPDAKLPA